MVRVCLIWIKPLHPTLFREQIVHCGSLPRVSDQKCIIVFLPKPSPDFHVGWDHFIIRASSRLTPKTVNLGLTLDLGCLYNHYLEFIWSVSWYTEQIQFPIVQGPVPVAVAGPGGWPCYRCSTLLPSPAALGALPCPLTLRKCCLEQPNQWGRQLTAAQISNTPAFSQKLSPPIINCIYGVFNNS